tara:strand:- start:1578 stop:1895 length:318 start_codon:yes stop_codon:yes gene_type:complete
MPLESSIVKAIMRAAKKQGWFVWKINGGPYQLAGMPDLQLLKNGKALFFEVKQPGKKATERQVAMMQKLSEGEARTPCFVVTSVEEANDHLQEFEKKNISSEKKT